MRPHLPLGLLVVGAAVLLSSPAHAQSESAGQAESGASGGIMAAPLRLELIDTPTAQVLPRGGYDVWMRLLGDGDALFGARVGMFDLFTFGASYGGSGVLGGGNPDWNPRIEFMAKIRVMREGQYPGVAIGFDSQGFGPFNDDLRRYEIKSRGFYAAVDRSIAFLGYLGLHGGASYSLENGDGEGGMTAFGGVEKSLGNAVVLTLEYDLGLNDDAQNSIYGEGGGFLNSGITWSVSEKFALDFQFRNLSGNGEGEGSLEQWNREVRIRMMDFF